MLVLLGWGFNATQISNDVDARGRPVEQMGPEHWRAAYKERIRAPPTAKSILGSVGAVVEMDKDPPLTVKSVLRLVERLARMDEERVRDMVSEMWQGQEKLHQNELRRVGSRNSKSAGIMEAF